MKKNENLFDIKIKNNKGKYEFDVYRRPGLANVQIKSYTCIPSSKITSMFKGFLARATKICSKEI